MTSLTHVSRVAVELSIDALLLALTGRVGRTRREPAVR